MPSLPGLTRRAFGVCQDLIGGETLASYQSLYLTPETPEAAPKCISDFGEYELSPSLISLSPLPSAHPEAFQRLLVRPSTWCYPYFSLAKGRSLGFASAPSD